MITPYDTLPYIINAILALCITVGAFFAVRNGRQKQLTEFQETTNTALTQRIAALEGKTMDLEKENAVQRHLIDTITSALLKEGIVITVSGDLVSIENVKSGTRSTHRKRSITTQQSFTKKEDA